MKHNNIKTSLVSMIIDEIKVDTKKYNPQKEDKIYTLIRFTTGVQSLDENVMLARIEVHILQDVRKLVYLKLSGFFKIELESWKSMIKGNTITLPKEMLLPTFSLLYSTARGVILMRNYSNNLKHILMPLFDSREFVPEDHTITIDN